MSEMDPKVAKFLTFSKPFVDAIKGVFETMVFSPLTPQKPVMKERSTSKSDIYVVMGLNGLVKSEDGKERVFKGMMVLGFPKETYVKIASAMLMAEYTDYNDEIKDVGAEIANITTGNAKKILSQIGFKIEMSIPSTVIGDACHIEYPKGTNVIEIPFQGNVGIFFMELCYQDF